ncbi:uncharacterized protein N7498_007421 [Penicillium cinerascens]|uniref:UBX domain-containing protein 2 n=1 Tax=Penicillium cinerascens TaxID=70096 RepID=A0A9W9JL41_9EURO|nr:uncharacterized protein N7498_007421 [Penicillium cinerascens]KAJ5198304.1 hypothetical protein N7498_007421 [Penicillium cinerascens]
MFFQGSLQDGIALAVREAKAVVCFVRDDEPLSSTWEKEYLTDDEVAPVLDAKAVLLRLTAGSQEAGFLTSFCPVSKFPTAVVIKNGTLQEYLTPEVSRDDLKSRLIAALEGRKDTVPAQQPQQNSAAPTSNEATSTASSNAATSVIPNTPNAPSQQQSRQHPSASQISAQQTSQTNTKVDKPATEKPAPTKQAASKPQPLKDVKGKSKGKQPVAQAPQVPQKPKAKVEKKSAPTIEEPKPQPPVPRGPPSQYRLQVRLFDGRSIRSSFKPTQTIRGDVRPWLDEQMEDDHRPYNLKHILTPLPNRTLSVAEESQTLQDLNLGSTANLVMVPVQTYTTAYAAAGSLPARGISAVYNVVSGVASTATGIVGSILGYGSSASANESESTNPPSGERRPRPTGPTIRTLRDQQNERGDNQFYNGNQLNFEPRNKEDKDN